MVSQVHDTHYPATTTRSRTFHHLSSTILLGTKSLGITPATVKVPAFEQSTLKIVKEGYAPDLQKITPKSNNLSILSMLKKQPAKRPR